MEYHPLLPRRCGKHSFKRQALSSIVVASGALSLGLCLGWSSPAIPQLRASNSKIPGPISDTEAGWVGALLPFGAFLTVPLAAPMMERCGRRWTIMLACVPMVFGWMLTAVARSVWMMYLGRTMMGSASSLYSTVVPVYIAEIAERQHRGVLGALFQLMCVFGQVSMAGLGVAADWDHLAYGAMVVPCLTFITVASQYETPNWLVKHRRFGEAKEVLQYFRHSNNVSDEFDELISTGESLDAGVNKDNPILKDRAAMKIIFYMMVMMLTNQLCGNSVVLTFTDSILQTAGVSIKPELAGFTVGLVMFLTTIISIPIVGRINRKPLLFTSLLFCSLSMFCFGFYFHMRLDTSYSWIPILCLLVFILSFSIGMGPLPWVLLGEFSVPHLAPLVATISGLTNWCAAFFMTVVFSDMSRVLGLAGTFWFYGSCSAIGALFSVFILPETRGRSFQEIKKILQ